MVRAVRAGVHRQQRVGVEARARVVTPGGGGEGGGEAGRARRGSHRTAKQLGCKYDEHRPHRAKGDAAAARRNRKDG
jgi:hypothetical protein